MKTRREKGLKSERNRLAESLNMSSVRKSVLLTPTVN